MDDTHQRVTGFGQRARSDQGSQALAEGTAPPQLAAAGQRASSGCQATKPDRGRALDNIHNGLQQFDQSRERAIGTKQGAQADAAAVATATTCGTLSSRNAAALRRRVTDRQCQLGWSHRVGVVVSRRCQSRRPLELPGRTIRRRSTACGRPAGPRPSQSAPARPAKIACPG